MAVAATQTTEITTHWTNEQLLRMLLDKQASNFPTLQLKGGLVEVKRVVVADAPEPLIEKRYLGRLSNFAKREFEYLNKVNLKGLERVALMRSLHYIPGSSMAETVVRTAWHGLDTLSWAQLLKAQPGRNGQDQPQYCFTRSAPAVLAWVRGVLRSCQTFHSLGFVHCDLLSRNIVIPYTVVNAGQRQFELNLDEPRIIDLELCLGPTTHGAWGEPPPRTGFFDNLGNPLRLNPQDRSEHLCPWLVKKQPDDALDTVARGKRRGRDGLMHDISPGRQYLRDSSGKTKAPAKLFAQLPRVDWGADLFSLGVAVREMIREASFEPDRHGDDSIENYLHELPTRLRSYDALNNGKVRPIPHADLIAEIDRLIGTDAYKRLFVTVPDDYRSYAMVVDSPTYFIDEFDEPPADTNDKPKPTIGGEPDKHVLPKKQSRTWHPALAGIGLLASAAGASVWWQQRTPPVPEPVASVPAPVTAVAPTPTLAAQPPVTPAPAPPAPAVSDPILAALRSANQAEFGTTPWRNAVDELASLCRTTSKSTDTQACTGAWSGLQQTYLERSTQAKQDAWIVESHYLKPDKPEPSKSMLAWLDATAVLAGHGLWLAQVNEAIGGMVAWRQKIQPSAIDTSSRAEAAKKLVNLVRTGGGKASAFGAEPPAASVRQYRIDAGAWLWVVARAGHWGHPESGKIAPVGVVLPAVQALADIPSQNLQNKLAYSLMCWSAQPDKVRALQYLAKALVPEDTSAEAKKIAKSAKVQTDMIRQGEDLCAPPVARK